MDTPLPLTPALWRAGQPERTRSVLPTGHTALDALLADGGWPRAALSELLLPAAGIGELPLLLPVLAAQAADGGCVVLVSPPYLPCLAAWEAAGIAAHRLLLLTPSDARGWLWSTEQAARTPGCCVLAWPPRQPAPGMRELRRLQLAAQQGDGLLVLLRDARLHTQSSPAALRLLLRAQARAQLHVEVVKQRGGFGGRSVILAVHERHAGPRLSPWQRPVHGATPPSSSPSPFPSHSREMPRAVAGHPLPRPADRPVDTLSGPGLH